MQTWKPVSFGPGHSEHTNISRWELPSDWICESMNLASNQVNLLCTVQITLVFFVRNWLNEKNGVCCCTIYYSFAVLVFFRTWQMEDTSVSMSNTVAWPEWWLNTSVEMCFWWTLLTAGNQLYILGLRNVNNSFYRFQFFFLRLCLKM